MALEALPSVSELVECAKKRTDVFGPNYNQQKTFPPSSEAQCRPTVHTKIYEGIADAIGNTPLIKLDRLAKAHGLKCNLLAKAEFVSVGGSIKDRIAKRMVEIAEQKGQIKPGDYIIEATSGNTGIGLSMMAAARGYKMIVVMPEKMSAEKANTMISLGAQVVRTRTNAKWTDGDSLFSVAYRLRDEINSRSAATGVKAVCLDQYLHEGNVGVHYAETAEELLTQTEGKIDMLVAAVGTGGTVTGTAMKLKEKCPDCVIVGVDPVGSILYTTSYDLNKDLAPFEIEGIGYDFHPSVFHHHRVDKWVKTNDRDSFTTAREAHALEALLCGGSSGSALWAALQMGATLKEGDNLVVILADSIRNYMFKFLSDDWMLNHAIFTNPTQHRMYTSKRMVPATTIKLSKYGVVTSNTKIVEINVDANNIAVTNDNNGLLGFVFRDDLRLALMRNEGHKEVGLLTDMHSIPLVFQDENGQVDIESIRILLLSSVAEHKHQSAVCLIAKGPAIEVLSYRKQLADAPLQSLDLISMEDFACQFTN